MNPADNAWLWIGIPSGVALVLAIMVIVILLGRNTGRDMVNGD